MVHHEQKINYKSLFTALLLSCFFTIRPVIAETELEKKEQAAREKEGAGASANEIKTEPLITLASIAARSGDLLGIPKGKQSPDSIALAMASAYKTNPDIQAQRSVVRAADEKVTQARAEWRPTVNAQLSSGKTNNRNFGNTINNSSSRNSTNSAEVTFNQNIYNGGATVAATEGAKATVKAQRASLMAAEQNVLFAAVRAYLDLIAKLAQLEVLRVNEGFLQTTLRSTKDKFDVGEETRTSVAQAEAQYARAVASRQTAEAELEALKATYQQVVGRPAGKLNKPTLPSNMPKTIEEALEKARLNNPEILSRQYIEIAARRQADQVNGKLLPSISFQARSSASSTDSRPSLISASNPRGNSKAVNHQATINVAIPLYEGGSLRSQKREAIETAEKNRVEVESKRREIEQLLIQAFANFKTAASNIKYYEEQIRASELSVEGTRQEIAVGSKTLLDLLNEQQKLLDARQALVEVEQRMYLAAYQVMVYMGMLTAKTMQLNVNYYDETAHYNEVKYAF